MKTNDFVYFAKSKYAWPGGYPMFAITNDGACLCHQCSLDNYRYIRQAQKDNDRSGWNVTSIDINWENDDLMCEHCGDKIESAYGDNDPT